MTCEFLFYASKNIQVCVKFYILVIKFLVLWMHNSLWFVVVWMNWALFIVVFGFAENLAHGLYQFISNLWLFFMPFRCLLKWPSEIWARMNVWPRPGRRSGHGQTAFFVKMLHFSLCIKECSLLHDLLLAKRHSLYSRTQRMYTRGVSNDSFSKINMCFCIFDIFVMCFLLVNNFYFSFMALYLWWKNVPLYEWMCRCFKLIKNLFFFKPCAHFSSIEDNASFKFGGGE